MTRPLIIILLCSIPLCSQAQQKRFIPYRAGDKWGYCDEAKKILISPQFKKTNLFYGDLAVTESDSGMFIIDRKGKRVSATYSSVGLSEDGKGYSGCRNYNECIYFNAAGKPITGTVYSVDRFNKDGLAVLRQEYSKAGVIDVNGNMIIPAQFRYVDLYPGKMAIVSGDKGFGFYNLAKNIAVPCTYSKLYGPQEGMMFAQKGELFGFLDTNGKEVIPFKYQRVPWPTYFGEQNFFEFNWHNFSEGLAVVMDGGKCGYIDKQGRTAIPFEYETAYGFSKGLAWVKKNGKWGMINKSGKLVIPCEYDEYATLQSKELEALIGLSDGMVCLKKNGKVGFADSLGRIVIPFQYEGGSSFRNGLAAVSENGLTGFINKKGQQVIPLKYNWITSGDDYYSKPFEKGYDFAMPTDSTTVFIDRSGKMLSQLVFKGFPYLLYGYFIGCSEGKCYVINDKGQTVMPVASDYSISIWENDLGFDYDLNCYVNLKTGMRYAD
jgi:hypothetical protein